jgi:hypothetical protein
MARLEKADGKVDGRMMMMMWTIACFSTEIRFV